MGYSRHDKTKICQLVAKLQEHPDAATARDFNDLLAEMFTAFSADDLVTLLRNSNVRIVKGALFIAEELGYRAGDIAEELARHAHHEDASVRHAAYEAIADCTTKKNHFVFLHVILGIQDRDAACRKVAMVCTTRASQAQLRASLEKLDGSVADAEALLHLPKLAQNDANDTEIVRAWILSANAVCRKVGIIAAGRLGHSGGPLLELAAASDDADVSMGANAILRFLSLSREKKRG